MELGVISGRVGCDESNTGKTPIAIRNTYLVSHRPKTVYRHVRHSVPKHWNRRYMVANVDWADLSGRLNSDVFGTDLSAVAATNLHWC